MYNMNGVRHALYEQSKAGMNFNNLSKLVVSPENILLAYRNVKGNKGAKTPGTDGKTMADIDVLSVEEVIENVRSRFNWYNPKPVRRVEIPKPNGKTRPLGIPTIWDRVIQQCILQILEPICEAKFLPNSKGFRPNKSAEDAIASFMYNINRRHMTWVVDVDIKGFFDNVDHTKLMRLVWKMGIHDKQLLVIIRKMLKAPIQMPDGRIEYPEKGTPQGGILSPLLANIYLHELDVWLASQWERMPTKHEYKEPPGRNGEPTRTKACRALRKNSRLKEIHHVRYADDFKIVCSNRDEAERIYSATQMWLKEELKLDISPEKSQITDLAVDYTEFLGFKIKAILKKNKWIGVSYIADKAMKRIYGMLATQINKIGKHADLESRNKDIAKYNAMVMGVHNYYHIATGVYNSLSTISLRILRKLYTKTRSSGFSKTCSKPAICIPAAYRETKQIRYIGDYPVLPIGYCRTKNAVQQKNNQHPYAEENRHQLVAIQISKMWYSRTAWADRIAFAVNCISRYAAQQGKCAITGRFLMMDEAEGHHITPRYKGGTDDYENIMILSPEAHLLIKVTNPAIIHQILLELKLNKKQLKRLNDLRSKYGTVAIS
ncbi:MAG: group II intron reverse transcriptase/maturase [Oscillospiraceae bacterium]|nr:group II intron reverse transcriptase/maturase [Oscillospiraceae bacterium]